MDTASADRRIRDSLQRTQSVLNNIDYQRLSADRKIAYNQAKDHIEGAQTALKDQNFELAKEMADKADKLRSASRRVSQESRMKDDPQEPQSIWWLTKMDVIGFRVILAEEEQPELVGLKPKVVKRSY